MAQYINSLNSLNSAQIIHGSYHGNILVKYLPVLLGYLDFVQWMGRILLGEMALLCRPDKFHRTFRHTCRSLFDAFQLGIHDHLPIAIFRMQTNYAR